jgi:hypothetical protein
MTLSTLDGSIIKKEYETTKEEEICKLFNLTRITTGKRRKADAVHNRDNTHHSIKNARSSSTQVWLTTLNKFRQLFNTPDGAIDLFLGDVNKNRFNFDELPQPLVDELIDWFNANKEDIIHRAIHGDDNIKSIIFRDLKRNKTYEIDTADVMSIVKDSSWRVGKRNGSLQLVYNGVVIFHFQREGKGRYPNNILFHIHRNLFTV